MNTKLKTIDSDLIRTIKNRIESDNNVDEFNIHYNNVNFVVSKTDNKNLMVLATITLNGHKYYIGIEK